MDGDDVNDILHDIDVCPGYAIVPFADLSMPGNTRAKETTDFHDLSWIFWIV